MIIFGDNLIPFRKINKINSIKDISVSNPNEIVYLEFNKEIAKYCFDNNISCAFKIDNLLEAIYSNSFKVDYIICEKELSKKVQKIAENYMFDSKILAIINNEVEIEDIAMSNVDGIIYKQLL